MVLTYFIQVYSIQKRIGCGLNPILPIFEWIHECSESMAGICEADIALCMEENLMVCESRTEHCQAVTDT